MVKKIKIYKCCSRCRIIIPKESVVLKCEDCLKYPTERKLFNLQAARKKEPVVRLGSIRDVPKEYENNNFQWKTTGVTLGKAARELNCHVHTIRKWVEEGRLRRIYYRRTPRILEDASYYQLKEERNK